MTDRERARIALLRASKGEAHSPADLALALRMWRNGPEIVPVKDFGLSEAQMRVAQLMAQGLSNKEIAETLNARETAIKSYSHQVLKKLGVNGRTKVAILLRGDAE